MSDCDVSQMDEMMSQPEEDFVPNDEPDNHDEMEEKYRELGNGILHPRDDDDDYDQLTNEEIDWKG